MLSRTLRLLAGVLLTLLNFKIWSFAIFSLSLCVLFFSKMQGVTAKDTILVSMGSVQCIFNQQGMSVFKLDALQIYDVKLCYSLNMNYTWLLFLMLSLELCLKIRHSGKKRWW